MAVNCTGVDDTPAHTTMQGVTAIFTLAIAVFVVALTVFVATIYWGRRVRQKYGHATFLTELGVDHLRNVVLRWMITGGLTGVDYYDGDDTKSQFFTMNNFEVFYVDVETRHMAFRMATPPSMYTSTWWHVPPPTEGEEDADEDYGGGKTLQHVGSNSVALYDNVPIYYKTIGLGAPDSLSNTFELRSVMLESEFLQLHPNAANLLQHP